MKTRLLTKAYNRIKAIFDTYGYGYFYTDNPEDMVAVDNIVAALDKNMFYLKLLFAHSACRPYGRGSPSPEHDLEAIVNNLGYYSDRFNCYHRLWYLIRVPGWWSELKTK